MHLAQPLFEDDHLLVVNKPAGLVSMGHPRGDDLQKLVGESLGSKSAPAFAAMVGRLDAPVSGVVLFAKTREAAQRLSDGPLSDGQRISKRYWAIVATSVEHPGELEDWLLPDKRHRRVSVVNIDTDGAKRSILNYRPIVQSDNKTALDVLLSTGRKHQIRVQLAHHVAPIVGDRKYGSDVEFPAGIALHARQVLLAHPINATPLQITAPLPDSWQQASATAAITHLLQQDSTS